MKKYIKASYGFTKNDSIHDWYVDSFPDDDLGDRISDVTFSEFFEGMKSGRDAYYLLGVVDSVIRERVFDAIADIYGISGNALYELWLATGMWETGQLALHEFKNRVKELGF